MGNTYYSKIQGSNATFTVTDEGVNMHSPVSAIDFKKEDLHAIAAEILSIGLDTKIGRFIPSASEYAAEYTEDELMRLAHRALQAVAKRRVLDEIKAKEAEALEIKRKHETLREAVADEFYDKSVFNLGAKALKAVDEIVSLRQLVVDTALENQ